MGLQYALYRKGLAFDSPEAVEFSDEVMEAVAFYAYEASSDLAAERGRYSDLQGLEVGPRPPAAGHARPARAGARRRRSRCRAAGGSTGSRCGRRSRRRACATRNVLAIAPTATISNIMGTSPCIEPLYKNLFVKSNLSGEFVVLNPYPRHATSRPRGLWNQELTDQPQVLRRRAQRASTRSRPSSKSATAPPSRSTRAALIDAAARRQKWIDQSQSLNLFLAEPDLKALSHMYRARLARRPEDDLLPAHARRLDDREGDGGRGVLLARSGPAWRGV